MSDILVFTATYNEKENINNLINEIFNISKEVDLLVIDKLVILVKTFESSP